jgi:hypothetical protein
MIEMREMEMEKVRQEGMLMVSMRHENILWAREFFFY